MAEKEKSRKGEMRRRWRAMLEDGSLAALRSEGRLVALYVLYAADWSSCEVRLSMRWAAKSIGVHPTTIRRGITQMVELGILEVLGKHEGSGKTRFVVPERAPLVRAPDTSGARPRTRAVRAPDTGGARAGHEPCAERARVVRGARTLCARNSVLSSGSQLRTSGDTSEASPGAGQGPAPASLPKVFDDPAASAAG